MNDVLTLDLDSKLLGAPTDHVSQCLEDWREQTVGIQEAPAQAQAQVPAKVSEKVLRKKFGM